MNKVRVRILFPVNYDEDTINSLVEQKFPEADLMFAQRTLVFVGSAERSQELLRAVRAVSKYDSVWRAEY